MPHCTCPGSFHRQPCRFKVRIKDQRTWPCGPDRTQTGAVGVSVAREAADALHHLCRQVESARPVHPAERDGRVERRPEIAEDGRQVKNVCCAIDLVKRRRQLIPVETVVQTSGWPHRQQARGKFAFVARAARQHRHFDVSASTGGADGIRRRHAPIGNQVGSRQVQRCSWNIRLARSMPRMSISMMNHPFSQMVKDAQFPAKVASGPSQ